MKIGFGMKVTVLPCFFAVFLVTVVFSNKADAIRKRTAGKIAKLEEVQALASGYREARAAQDAIERQLQASNLRLMSYVEEKGQKAGLEIPTINPKSDITLEGTKIVESAVEVTLTDVKLNRLLDFLASLEAGPGGTIRRCRPQDPSWANWPVLEHAVIGNIVPDFPLINKSFNLSYSGHDL